MRDALLIVGADGLLGRALHRYWRTQGTPVYTAGLPPANAPADWLHLDLAQPADTWPTLPNCQAAVLCAAITRLDPCRTDPPATRWINVHQTLTLARRLVEQGTFVVFPSSNLVFDGSRPAFAADAAVCPQTEYGRQKAETEAGLSALGLSAHAVVRLTKVFHPDMPLLRDWASQLKAGKPISPWSDLRCAPIALETTVRGLARVAAERRDGIWQFSPSVDSSYAELARVLARWFGLDASLVQPVAGGDSGGMEHLPRHTTLDASRATCELGLQFDEAAVILSNLFPHEHERRSV